jgi:mannose-6-phosphate isomerase-like protein (cupin superfamily)
MKYASLLILLIGLTWTAFAADDPAKTGVMLIGHDKVAEAFAKGGPLLSTNNFKVQAGHRTGPGEVELHERDTDIFYIMEGSAVFVTGGNFTGAKTIAPGETRAQKINGGEEHKLTKGDIIVIPKGVPHWFKEIDGTFDYLVVKVST